MRIILTVLSGPLKGLRREFAPAPERIRIGRSQQGEFSIYAEDRKDPHVSRTHCELEIAQGVCQVRDHGSNNGTRINDGPRIERAELQDGDRLRLTRDTELKIEIVLEPHEQATLHVVPPPKEESNLDQFEVLPCLVCTTPRPRDGNICAACREQRSREPQPIPGFVLLRELGQGGMGVVWLAEEKSTRRLAAIKLIRSDCAMAPAQIARFLHEVRYLAEMNHPNIVHGTSAQTVTGGAEVLYFVMDYVPGIDAAELVRTRGPLGVKLAVNIISEVLHGLAYAHAAGVIHRDLKPANVLVVESPWLVKLADFGLAYQVQDYTQVSRLTKTNELGGTLAYLPPEQALGLKDANFASDQYGAAATLYNLLTGKTVHDLPQTLGAQLNWIITYPVVPIRQRRPDLSPTLATVIHRALEMEPEDRYANVEAFARALKPFAG